MKTYKFLNQTDLLRPDDEYRTILEDTWRIVGPFGAGPKPYSHYEYRRPITEEMQRLGAVEECLSVLETRVVELETRHSQEPGKSRFQLAHELVEIKAELEQVRRECQQAKDAGQKLDDELRDTRELWQVDRKRVTTIAEEKAEAQVALAQVRENAAAISKENHKLRNDISVESGYRHLAEERLQEADKENWRLLGEIARLISIITNREAVSQKGGYRRLRPEEFIREGDEIVPCTTDIPRKPRPDMRRGVSNFDIGSQVNFFHPEVSVWRKL